MFATMLYGPGDVRFEERPEPKIRKTYRRHHQAFSKLRVRV